MSVWSAIALGILQGLTEFLPVSSSGHLALVEHFAGIESPGVTFEVLVHFGTALAVIVFFRRRIALILGALCRLALRREYDRDEARLGLHLLVGTAPAGAVGVVFGSKVEAAFGSPALVSACLLATGVVLWATRRLPPGRKARGSLWDAILIGAAQAGAVFPGVSRSGATVSAGLGLGLERKAAADFAFLLAVPVILGATAVSLGDALGSGSLPGAAAIAGTAAAFLAALPAIRVLLGAVIAGRLHLFSYYCWIAGALGLVLTALRG
jgi:undecaprenyl-diphosphatase